MLISKFLVQNNHNLLQNRLNLAVLYRVMKNYEAAINEYEELINLRPD